jgi:hypothetical protein
MTRERNPNDINNNLEPPFLKYEKSEMMNRKIDSIRLPIWRTI